MALLQVTLPNWVRVSLDFLHELLGGHAFLQSRVLWKEMAPIEGDELMVRLFMRRPQATSGTLSKLICLASSGAPMQG